MAPSPGRKGVLRISRLLNTKNRLSIGTWNVRTMIQESKIDQLEEIMQEYKIDILAITETRWSGMDKIITPNGNTLILSGRDDELKRQGVALLLNKKSASAMTEWKPAGSRLMTARFKSRQCNLSVIVGYAPINDAEDEAKDAFYEQIQDLLSTVPDRDMKIVLGDFNAKVGNCNVGQEQVLGKHGLGTINENGVRLVSLCSANNLVIGGTMFNHKNIHKYTWTSPDGKHRNQIDHVMIGRKRKKSLLDVRTYRGADIGSDHQLVLAKIKLKLKVKKKEKPLLRYDTKKLIDPNVKEEFVLECRSRFTVLAMLSEDEENELELNRDEQKEIVNNRWRDVKEVYQGAANEILGRGRTVRKKWISNETWNIIQRRKKQKIYVERIENDDDALLIESAKYWSLNSEVKRCSRRDKRMYLDSKAEEADKALNSGTGHGVSKAYAIIDEISGTKKNSKKLPIRDLNGNMLTSEDQIKERWTEHFKMVMNKTFNEDTILDLGEPEEILDINLSEITREDIVRALKQLKMWKAPGPDGLTAEMFKADIDTSADILIKLLKEIWNFELTPDEWDLGIITKIAKSGDLRECSNWRGITIASIVLKIMSLIILNRIKDAVDEKLRDEQAGFRSGRGCSDQIFVLRHIVQQSVEHRVPLALAFVDFEKAFDSVHRPTLWRVLRSYGLPDKYVNLIRNIHEASRCQVNVDGELSPEFYVSSGVLQGNVLSPLLFAVLIDYVMKETTGDRRMGIDWVENKHLSDMEYADDVVLISRSIEELQTLMNGLEENGKRVGLKVNINKTKAMKTDESLVGSLKLENRDINEVNTFKYLGAIIRKDGSLEDEFTERLKKGNQVMGRLSKIWKSHRLSIHTKIKLYISLVRSVLTYGNESWYCNETIERRFRAFENKALRRILGVRWQDRVTNDTIREITKVPWIDEWLMANRWRWLGHVLRMDQQRIIREVIDWEPVGTRRRGRPRPTWMRTIKKEAGNEWEMLPDRAQDRVVWRDYVKALCVGRRWRR